MNGQEDIWSLDITAQNIRFGSSGKSLDSLNNEVTNNRNDFISSRDDILRQLGLLADSSRVQLEFKESVETNGVTKLQTNTGYTFDKDGLQIDKSDSNVKSLYNDTGIHIIDKNNDEEILFAGYDNNTNETKVEVKSLHANNKLYIGAHSIIDDYNNGTGIYLI